MTSAVINALQKSGTTRASAELILKFLDALAFEITSPLLGFAVHALVSAVRDGVNMFLPVIPPNV